MGPKRFIECLLPVTACNLKCDYCYIIQENRRSRIVSPLKYPPSHICKCLTKERLGGTCYISICGAGETLIPKYIVEIVHGLLLEGHFVNITTNGTITSRFIELLRFDKSLLKHLHFAFSFHYIELKEKSLIDVFFDNIDMVKKNGCSFCLQMNLYDGYIPYFDEIKSLCIKKVGALPQVAVTRNELGKKISIFTSLNKRDYKAKGESFESPLFDFTMKNFNVRRNEFCYAGEWSFLLNLETGIASRCYFNLEGSQNIFDDPKKPILLKPVGNFCNSRFCYNSSHFLSLGTIPSLSTPSYAALRNRKSAYWYSNEMENFLNKKLSFSNKTYNKKEKRLINKNQCYSFKYKFKRKIKCLLDLLKIK